MPAAPLLMDEPFRLQALDALRVLDTAPEPGFDRIVLIARALTGAPTALVSLVDADRQWFKAKSGIDAMETHRDNAFCAHAIQSNGVTWVEDATLDPRFSDNPLVSTAPFIRFYAGAPIRLPGDVAVGTVCVFGPEPRAHDAMVSAALKALGDIAAEMLAGRANGR